MAVAATVERFDPHPALYYQQLAVWSAASASTLWLRANSVAWYLLGVLAIYAGVRTRYDRRNALFAAVCVALAPISVRYATEVRMYAMIGALAAIGWALVQCVRERGPSVAAWVGLFAAGALATYSHGLGVLVSLSILTALALDAGNDRRRWGFIALLALALGGVALRITLLFHRTELAHLLEPTVIDLLQGGARLFSGAQTPGWIEAGIALCAFGVALSTREARRTTIAFVLVPCAILAVLSWVVTPAWRLRVVAWCAQFCWLAVALAVSGHPARNIKRALVLGALVTSLILQRVRFEPPFSLVPMIEELRARVGSDDLVVLPSVRFWWSWQRYAAGPGSFDPFYEDLPYAPSRGTLPAVCVHGARVPRVPAHAWQVLSGHDCDPPAIIAGGYCATCVPGSEDCAPID